MFYFWRYLILMRIIIRCLKPTVDEVKLLQALLDWQGYAHTIQAGNSMVPIAVFPDGHEAVGFFCTVEYVTMSGMVRC